MGGWGDGGNAGVCVIRKNAMTLSIIVIPFALHYKEWLSEVESDDGWQVQLRPYDSSGTTRRAYVKGDRLVRAREEVPSTIMDSYDPATDWRR